MKLNPGNIIFRIVLVALALFPIACSHMQTAGTHSRRAALDRRVDQLWKARMDRDDRTVYDLTDLTYQKAVSKDEFIQKPGFQVLSYEIQDVAIQADDADSALVSAVFETVKMAMKMKLRLKEKWIYEQGAWRLDLTDMMRKGPFGPWGTAVKNKK